MAAFFSCELESVPPATGELHRFWQTGRNLEAHLLRAQKRMCRRKPRRSRLLFRANPYGARSANQRERVVANHFRGPLKFQLDGIVRKRPYGAVFVGHAQNDARYIRSIRVQTRVIGQQREFLIDTLAGKCPCNR